MDLHLTKLQKQLCNALQDGLPVCSRPFAEIANRLNSNEKKILQQTRQLKKTGVIRRIRALINYRALGKISTLVAAHVPQKSLSEVVETINSIDGVSHNYLRDHFYNLWFTLLGQTATQIEATLFNLSKRFAIEFHSLPVKRFFKLDVRFDAFGSPSRDCLDSYVLKKDANRLIPVKKINKNQKLILSKLQDDIAIAAEPFASFSGERLGVEDVLRIMKELIDKDVIRRIAAIVDHHKLGFIANVLFASEIPQGRIAEAGEKLARLGVVSHCYERKTFEDWPYNLFAMMHGRSMSEIMCVIDDFIEAERIDSFQILSTIAELKKQPVKHELCRPGVTPDKHK